MKLPREVLLILIRSIPNAKVVVPCTGIDLNPMYHTGKENIDSLRADPQNSIFAIDLDGDCHYMQNAEEDFLAALGRRSFFIAFCVPYEIGQKITQLSAS